MDIKYKWSFEISSFIATIYLKGLLIRKGLGTSLLHTENVCVMLKQNLCVL